MSKGMGLSVFSTVVRKALLKKSDWNKDVSKAMSKGVTEVGEG